MPVARFSVTSLRRSGSRIGSSNDQFQPFFTIMLGYQPTTSRSPRVRRSRSVAFSSAKKARCP
jgi:hypothetical protein